MPHLTTENLWGSDFGNDYHRRSPGSVEANAAFFEIALMAAPDVGSILEFGAGVGNNLRALRQRYPKAEMATVEINTEACLQQPEFATQYLTPISDFTQDRTWGLTLSKGVLIHQPPEAVNDYYEKMYCYTSRYILMAEYYSPRVEMIEYRGTTNSLWKRPFMQEMMDRFTDLRLLDYGFQWCRDEIAPQDDLTWALWEKK